MQGIFTQIRQLTHDVKSFHINISKRPTYASGQFLLMGLNAQEYCERAYSIASPNHWENVELLVKLHPGGQLTPTLFNKKVGDVVDIQMPLGKFSLGKKVPEKLVFVAGGVGLAPLLSMMRHLEHVGHDGEKVLIYGNRSPKDIVYQDELNRLAREGNTRLIYTVDNAARPEWVGNIGLIDQDMIATHCDLDASNFYLCGPPKMVDFVHYNLESLGIEKKRINADKW